MLTNALRCISFLGVAWASSTTHAVLLLVPNEAIESQDGKYVLVLLVPDSFYREAGVALHDYDPQIDGPLEPADIARRRQAYLREKTLRDAYPSSGLYRTDDSTTPVWTTKWSSDVKDVFVANDGVHHVFAFTGWDTSISNRGNALEFYRHGKLIATYDEPELLSSWRLRLWATQWLDAELPTCTSAQLDNAAGTFTIRTNHGDVFVFDISTGQLVNQSSSWSGIISLLWIFAIAGGIAFLLFLMHRAQRRKISQIER